MFINTEPLVQDPREYLPFLRELRALEKYYQRFKINDHLKRYELALQNLRLAGELLRGRPFLKFNLKRSTGPTHFEEAISYIEHHQLYQYALAIWKDSEQYNVSGDIVFPSLAITDRITLHSLFSAYTEIGFSSGENGDKRHPVGYERLYLSKISR